MADTSIGIKIAVDSGQVKTNLDKVQAEFESTSSKITKALQSIKGFVDLKKQTEETSKAYAEAQQKVAGMAREIKSGAGGAALAKDFERAKTEAGRLKDALAGQQQQLQQARSAMAALGVSTTSLAGQQTSLRTQLDATQKKYQDLAKVAAARDTLNLTSHADITAEINKARAAYATLAASGKLSMAELAQAKVSMRDRIDELTQRTNGWRDALGQIKGRLFEVAAAFGGIVLASRQAIAFESAMADVGKTVDGSKEQIAQLGNELRDMSFKIPLPVEELAGIAAAGGQLGVAAKDIGAFTEVTAKMATAFNMTAEAAGQAIGTMSNVWQVGVGEIELFGDAINQLGNNTAATESKIVDVLLRIGGTARQFGLAKEQAAALASTMLSLGQSPEVASTSINALLVRMQTATQQSDKFQEALGRIGMSAEEMAVMVEANPQKALETLLNTLSELKGRERAEVLTGLFGAEYQDNISVLVGSLDKYQEALGMVSDQTKYAGAMNREFEVRAATTAAQLRLLWNVVTDIFKSIGQGFLPAIKMAAEWLRAMLSPIAAIVQAVPGLSAALVSLGTGMLVYGTVTKLLGILKMGLSGIGVASANAAAPVATLFRTLATGIVSLSMANPVLAAITGALAIGAAAWNMFGEDSLESSQKHAEAASKLGSSIAAMNQEVVELEDLKETLLGTAEGTQAHVLAEEKLASVVPKTTQSLDEQGRVLAVVKDATSGNIKVLQEYIDLKKADARVQAGLQLEQQAKAYFKAADAVGEYKSNLDQWYGIGRKTTSVTQEIWLGVNRLTGTYDANIQKGSELRENLNKQKKGFEELLASLAKSGTAADEVSALLSGVKIDEGTKARIVAEYQTMFAAINGKAKESAGVRIGEEKKVSTETAKSAARQKQVTGEALKEMEKQYKEYADNVKRLQGELADSQRSVEEELRDMKRSGMSDLQAWQDRKLEAGEFSKKAREAAEAARQLVAGGNMSGAEETYKVAMEYADKAKRAYAGLNEEVKQGDKVVISGASALQTAMEGVRSAGDLKSKLITEQIQAFSLAQAKLNAQSGGKLDAALDQTKTKADQLATSADTAKQKVQELFQVEPPADGDWGKVWTAMESGSTKAAGTVTSDWDKVWDAWLASGSDDVAALERKLSELIKDRTMTVRIKTVEEKSTGGMIMGYHLGGAIQALATGGGVRNILGGGHLPGFGGGDTVPLWGEAGEFMLNKWASLKAGLPALKHLNAGDIGAAIAELTKRMQTNFGYRLGGMVQSISGRAQRLATGGAVAAGGAAAGGETMTINLGFDNGVTVPVTSTRANAKALKREFRRMEWRSSK